MKHPPYHLRVNKAIDRFLLVEIIDILKKHCEISDYTYYGFGGPFLDDCRLIHSLCPEIKIVSIEQDKDTFKRQKFHSFSKILELRHEDFASFVADFSSNDKAIFWLDYTGLKLNNFDEFKNILQKVSENSVVKITLRAERLSNAGNSENRKKKWAKFQNEFAQFLPSTAKPQDIERAPGFTNLIQEMLQIASQQILPAEGESVFQLLSSCYYKEPTQILSITGMVCNRNQASEIRE